MRRLLIRIAVAAAALVAPAAVGHAQMQWREAGDASAETVQALNDPDTSDGVEIGVSGSTIVVRTPKSAEVRVFTILGQLVSRATLNPGTSELTINSRGIYIVKIGDTTQKIAL